jgi:formyl-CoA transferase
MVLPLEGIRVLDFTHMLFGPSSTQVLGDFGADVVKVEPPGGEPGRSGRGEPYATIDGVNVGFLSRNRNKRSLVVNLRMAEGKEVVRRLAAVSDVVVQNFRPGVAERLGLAHDDLRVLNPRLVYVVGTGYGPTGPYQSRGGQDRAAQAMSGLMSTTGEPDWPPVAVGQPIIDVFAGMLLAQGVLLALMAREKTGRGQRVDVSLLDTAIVAGMQQCTNFLTAGQVPVRRIRPLMDVYRTADGHLQLITTFMRTDNRLQAVCRALEIDDLSTDPRFASPERMEQHVLELREILRAAFLRRPTADWMPLLEREGIIGAPVYDYGQVFSDPQVQHNRMVMETDHPRIGPIRLVAPAVKLSETPGWVHRPPPLLGQHTDEILASVGYSAAEIAELHGADVVD